MKLKVFVGFNFKNVKNLKTIQFECFPEKNHLIVFFFFLKQPFCFRIQKTDFSFESVYISIHRLDKKVGTIEF